MELSEVISHMLSNAKTISALLENISDEKASWKPGDKWSLLEIINHLYDEEREDFRQRLKLTLENPENEWPGISPAEWITERNYAERDFHESLSNFLKEREISIKWLESLDKPNWMNTYDHPELGKMSASKILYNWLAHDFLHIRQITRTLYLYLEENVSPTSLEYAGNW